MKKLIKRISEKVTGIYTGTDICRGDLIHRWQNGVPGKTARFKTVIKEKFSEVEENEVTGQS